MLNKLLSAAAVLVAATTALNAQTLAIKGLYNPETVKINAGALVISNAANYATPESGFILKSSPDGKGTKKFFAGQINTPKGFDFINKNTILIADHIEGDGLLGHLVAASFETGKILAKLEVENSVSLGSVAKMTDRNFAVSDTGSGKIYSVAVDKYNMIQYKTLASGFRNPSGLFYSNGILYIACTGSTGQSDHAGLVYTLNVKTGKIAYWTSLVIGKGHLGGLAVNGSMLYVSDVGTKAGDSAIYVFDVKTKAVLGKYDGLTTVSNFDISGGFIWAPETSRNNIKKIALSAIKPASLKQAPAPSYTPKYHKDNEEEEEAAVEEQQPQTNVPQAPASLY